MKRIIPYLIINMAAALLAGCEDSWMYSGGDWRPTHEAYYIYTDLKDHTLQSEANSSVTGYVAAENTQWRFANPAEWLSVSPLSGNTDQLVNITAKTANPSGEDIRTSVFALESAVSSYKYSHPVSVTQAASTPYMNIIIDGEETNGLLIETGVGTTRTIDVSTNVSWTVSSDKSWCHANASNDGKQIHVTVDDNPNLTSRSAKLTVTSDVITKQVEVIQVGANIVVSPETLNFDCSGGKYTIAVNADLPWSATATGSSWLTISPSSGIAGTTNVTISALENASTASRPSTIDFMLGENKAVSVRVQQNGMSVSLGAYSMTFGADGQEQTLSISSNTAWWVYDIPSWLAVSKSNGNGDATLSFTAEEYWGIAERSADIMIGNKGVTGLCETLKIKQKAREIKPMRSLQFDANADSDTIHVDIPRAWTAEPQGDAAGWISVSPASAEGAAVLNVSVTENMEDRERDGIILVKVGEVSTFITVTQRGKFINVSPTFAPLPQAGGTHIVTISSNNSWTARTTSPWMKLSATSGRGDAELKLTADANRSTVLRRDTTVVEPEGMQPIRIVTAQEGYFVKVDNTSLMLNGRAGRSNTVIVTTNGTYKLKADYGGAAPWFTIAEEGKTFAVVAEENGTEEDRKGKVIITLDDVPATDLGRTMEIPITQRCLREGVSVEPFGSDQIWEISSDGSITIRVMGYKEDKSQDGVSETNADIPVNDFGDDQNWDY